MANLQCTRCGAPVELPNDFGVWLARCQYCGFEFELPDRPARQAYAERQREEAASVARIQADTTRAEAERLRARNKQRRMTAFIVTGSLLLVAAITTGIVAAVSSASSTASTNSASGPPAALVVLASKATAAGCPKVLDGPSEQQSEYKGTFTIVKRECMRFLAVGAQASPITLQVTDAAGAVTTRAAQSGSLDETFCTQENAEHLVKISGGASFWVEALTCPRTFAKDPATTGMTRVSERLKQLMSHGCHEISLAATTESSEQKLTTPLEAGTCFDLIAISGVADNSIRAKLTTPFGENVAPLPAPTTNLEFAYCATAAGPHVIELSPAVDGPYSMAIAICNRGALPKVLPKAAK